ncbi:MAG: hypothetical protein ABJK11_05895 [Balneola sp.]
MYIADPAVGKVVYSKKEFLKNWLNHNVDSQDNGIVLLLYTIPKFFEQSHKKKDRLDFTQLFEYLKPYKNLIGQLAFRLGVGSVLR